MFGDVLAAFISAGCLTSSGWYWFQGLINQREDELYSLYLLIGFILLPLGVLFGMLSGGEAWVFVGVIWFVGICIYGARSFFRFEEAERY